MNKVLKQEFIKIIGGEIPITLSQDPEGDYIIDIDGVEWVVTDNPTHATVMFVMMKDHITEYMHYQKT